MPTIDTLHSKDSIVANQAKAQTQDKAREYARNMQAKSTTESRQSNRHSQLTVSEETEEIEKSEKQPVTKEARQ